MKTKVFLIGVFVLMALAAAYAADVTGKWVAEQQGMRGPTKITFDLKAEGEKLTGTMQRGDTDPTPITEGKIEGDNVSFVVVRQGRSGEMKITYKGVVTGDEMKLTPEMPAGGMGGPGAGGPPPGAGAPGGGPGGGGGMGMGRGMGSMEIIAKRVK